MSHLDPSRLAGLATLGTDDPERREAEQHADQCPPCRQALDHAARTISLLESVEPIAPSPRALARAREAVLAEMDRGAHQPELAPWLAGRWGMMVAGAAVVGWALTIALARHRDDGAIMLSGVVAAIAALGALASFTYSRVAIGALVLASIALALTFGSGGSLDALLGAECALHELLTASAPLAITYVLARRGHIQTSAMGFATAAGYGALAGQAALLVACPSTHALPHVLVFHAGGVIAAALAGAALARVQLARSAQP